MAYYGKIPPRDSEHMAIFERDMFYDKLLEIKKKEKEQYDKAKSGMKNNKKL